MNRLARLLPPRSSLVHRSRRSYRFIPSKPLWRWHDDRSPCSDNSVFSIPPEEIPPRIELDDQTLKLLERLSLVNFNKEVSEDTLPLQFGVEIDPSLTMVNILVYLEKTTKAIVEEAIHFADCLLTPTAFRCGATRTTVEPMISLLGEEGWEPVEVVGEGENEGSDSVAATAAHILHHAPVTWENYFVAPPGNQPIHPELGGKTGSSDD